MAGNGAEQRDGAIRYPEQNVPGTACTGRGPALTLFLSLYNGLGEVREFQLHKTSPQFRLHGRGLGGGCLSHGKPFGL
jgi:hypothetical protein